MIRNERDSVDDAMIAEETGTVTDCDMLMSDNFSDMSVRDAIVNRIAVSGQDGIQKDGDGGKTDSSTIKNGVCGRSSSMTEHTMRNDVIGRQNGDYGRTSSITGHTMRNDVIDRQNGDYDRTSSMTEHTSRSGIVSRQNGTADMIAHERGVVIADGRFRSRFRVNHLTFKNYKEKFIRYDDLSAVEKYELYKYATFMLSSSVSESKLSFIRKIMGIGTERRAETAEVHPFIFRIMDHIKAKYADYHGIFRCAGDYRASMQLYDQFMQGKSFDLNTTDIRNIVTFFKIYLSRTVNGIFSFDILDTLYKTARYNTSPSINYLLFYLPYCFVGDKRRFLISMLDMFRSIDRYKHINNMPIANLVRCIAPTLFPKTKIKNINTVLYQTWAVHRLFDIDLERVPKPLLEFSHIYVMEKGHSSIC